MLLFIWRGPDLLSTVLICSTKNPESSFHYSYTIYLFSNKTEKQSITLQRALASGAEDDQTLIGQAHQNYNPNHPNIEEEDGSFLLLNLNPVKFGVNLKFPYTQGSKLVNWTPCSSRLKDESNSYELDLDEYNILNDLIDDEV
ncbi:uncharacterized protein LOC141679040 [Apium graveolens]|uniref:uncharacterized protein LOC141679040 n=1 Tax=Apium graveolens TaxID=4045 RepID=UPI003D7ACAF6